MQTVKTLWKTLKTLICFAWRHVLTLYTLILIVMASLEIQNVSIKNIMILIISTAILDWLKMKIKTQSNTSFRASSDAPQPLHVQNYWNGGVVGSPSYLSSMGSSPYPL